MKVIKRCSREDKAIDLVGSNFDYVMDTIVTPDFVEVTGKMGGDCITFRVYNDGTIYER